MIPPAPPYLLLRVALWPFEDAEPLAARETTRLATRGSGLRAQLDERGEALKDQLFEAAGPPDPDAEPQAARRRLAVVALRRDVHNRRPLEPDALAEAVPRLGPPLTAALETWNERRRELDRTDDPLHETFERELAAARTHLLERTRRDTFRLALRLASRHLLRDLDRLPAPDPSGETWRHTDRHAAATLAAYLNRAVSKTSPQGLLAATAPARWLDPVSGVAPPAVTGRHSKDGSRLPRRELLLHVVEARKITATVGSVDHPALWAVLEARVNPTLHEEAPGPDDDTPGETPWYLWRPASLADEDSRPVLRRMRVHPVARVLVDRARRWEAERGRPPSLAELESDGIEATGLPSDKLTPFLAQLARAGLFPREVELPYTTHRPLEELARRAETAGLDEGSAPWLPTARAVEDRLRRAATEDPDAALVSLDVVTETVDALPHRRPLATDDLFRLDAASGLATALPASVLDELQAAVDAYARLAATLYPRPALTRALARRSRAAFEADRDIPALEVYRLLEGQGGRSGRGRPEGEPAAEGAPDPRLAFPPPLPPGAATPESTDHPAARAYEAARRTFTVAAQKARVEERNEMRWEDLSLEEIVPDDRDGPRWLAAVNFQVAAEDGAAVAAGRYRLVLNDLFTGVGLALSRFAHLHKPADPAAPNPIVTELRRHLEDLRRASAAPDGAPPIVAEITFNHWGPAANAGLRPAFLEHEIELPGQRASPAATVLPLTELSLRWDSQRPRMVLIWRPAEGSAREVLPVLTSGVAPEGFASLLVGIGRQVLQPLTLFPGFPPPEADEPFAWPRVVHGRVVLMRRRWFFPPGCYPAPPRESAHPDTLLARFFQDIHAWRHHHDLPRHLFVRTNREPKPFWVDLEAPLAVDLLRRLLSPPNPNDGVTTAPVDLHVEEMLPGPEELWVRDEAGRYAAEFLVQMGRL